MLVEGRADEGQHQISGFANVVANVTNVACLVSYHVTVILAAYRSVLKQLAQSKQWQDARSGRDLLDPTTLEHPKTTAAGEHKEFLRLVAY